MSTNPVINILDFGADASGQTICTESLQRALDSVDGVTPTRVLIPKGRFVTGLLYPKSNTEIHLAKGAILQASPVYEHHRHEDKVGGILLARNLENISVTGVGEINGDELNWFFMDQSRTYIDYDINSIQQGAEFVAFDNPFQDGPVEPKERPGNMLIFSNCRKVALKDFSARGSAYWTIHLADCVNIEVENLTISHNQNIPNNDGIHMTSCRHAVLKNLDIQSGDDCIALTGFRDLKGEPEIELGFTNLEGELLDIHVENCRLSSRSSGIRIGYGENNMSQIHLKDIEIYDSNRGILIQARDAGDIHDVHCENIKIQTRYMAGSWWGNGEPISISSIHRLKNLSAPLGEVWNIHFKNIQMTAPTPAFLYADQEGTVRDISFENCQLSHQPDPLFKQKGQTVDLRPVHDYKLALINTDKSDIDSINVATDTVSGSIQLVEQAPA
ncbi:glycoside hydrolase family 28 protein [Cerasicoccus fimbriatus]|uniref:glycoside hydrolase family 28 protein n=1 Tax=Cerasicoccus fimbriatus TaxID=3014554 RepID=UPI0022B4C238|nr:glycosyl hydrolase family 28 protein [Cerasicoccus sp. TK19100]